MSVTVDEVQRVVHHVFLPPQLPQKADEESEITLINTTLWVLGRLRSVLLPQSPLESLENAIALLVNIKAINSLPGGKIDEIALRKTLASLPVGRSLAANVSSQNAAVLITRRQDELVFEVFELSPLDADVVQTEGRLTRTFPGQAVAVPAKILDQPDFVTMVANTLSTMSCQQVPGMQPQSLKSGQLHDELRDTANPAMVSELFMGVLAGIGTPISVSSISKNTRDEVLWDHAKFPWRRSPMWLLIRVSLQLILSRSSGGSSALYKEVMVFLMSCILSLATRDGLAPDMLYAMAAKIDWRLRKLSGTGPPLLPGKVRASIDDILQQSYKCLEKTWYSCQQVDSRDLQLAMLSTLNFEQDTLVAIGALDDHVKAMHGRQHGSTSSRFVPSSLLLKYDPACFPTLPNSHFKGLYAAANLFNFEQWVAQHLIDWVRANEQDDVCDRLHDLMLQYHHLAKSHYSGNPETTSVMVLTMFELWVACDTAALRHCPWLIEYDPGIPAHALQNLLLPLVGQMERLRNLEDYIETRRRQSGKKTDLLFATHSSNSFASQYFDKSASHQALLSKIVSHAETARRAKRLEFQQVKAQYNRLDALYNGIEHESITKVIDTFCDPPETKQVHYPHRCQKCSYASQRDRLSITVHEWPLPSNDVQAKLVVFELDVPSWFANWRSVRLVLLRDVLGGILPLVQPSTKYLLSANDPHLAQWHTRQWSHRRIDLLSQTKPLLGTHYRNKTITALQESQVCVPNGLQYKYYDSHDDQYPGDFTFKDVIPRACTYTMHCEALQRFLFRPASAPDGPGPNTVLASQEDCPANMTLEEYKDLCTLPLGHRIQWSNILVQLAMPTVDFKEPKTTLFMLQCAYQTGPPSEEIGLPHHGSHKGQATLRSSHEFFNNEQNGRFLLQNLTTALQRVKSNWESSQALFIFAAIAARALSLSASVEVQSACLVFLSTAREIAMEWVVSLRDKAYEAVDHSDRTAFTAKSVEVALICTSTFDIDRHHLEIVLGGKKQASILVQASIIVQEGEHTLPSGRESFLALLAMRQKRLLCRACKCLAQNPCALDDAIKKAWSAYTQGSTWRPASETIDHWVTTDTLATTQATSMGVHYNLLSGELLVNGLPLDQPPQEYRAHPQYSTLFGKAVVEVMPSVTPGFQFSTKREFGGSSVQLGMSGGDLIVRATKGDVTYETIPKGVFGEAYPTSFVDDYVHWYNTATETVEFRPVAEPWNPTSPEVWTLSRLRSQWELSKSGSSVVGLGCSTLHRVSHVLEPLADERHIHSILQSSDDTKALLVSIPTLRLSFSLAQRSRLLVSNEFRSMAVDADQSLGTFVGLRSKLVLKHSTSDDRMVLLPESNVVAYQQTNGHISVAVSKASIHKVHALRVDPTLGRLLDNSELGCKLFQAYLHALTSFCLVDPLTHKTGTEQALTILKSAAVRSFDQLSQEHIDMLVKISGLSPRRGHYPVHLRVMQTVGWKKMGFLSQHGHFITMAKTLLQQAERARIFFPDAQLTFPSLNDIDEHLIRRDNIRSATFRVSGFGAEDHTVQRDRQYTARDRRSDSQLAIQASNISQLVFRDGVGLFYPALANGGLWQALCAYDMIHGPQVSIKLASLKYDAGLVKEGYDYVLQYLPALYHCIGTSKDSKQHKFSIMMWLSTIARNPKADLSVLQSVAMFLKSTVLAQIPAPWKMSFKPNVGVSCARRELSRKTEAHFWPFGKCPEFALHRERNEKKHAYDSRCKQVWRTSRSAAATAFVNALTVQWPCEVPKTPAILSIYINVVRAMEDITVLFGLWHDNTLLDQYLGSIEQGIRSFEWESIESVSLNVSLPESNPSALGYVPERSIFFLPAPDLPDICHTFHDTLGLSTPTEGIRETPRLENVIKTLEDRGTRSESEAQYLDDLRASLDALMSRDHDGELSANVNAEALLSYFRSCKKYVQDLYGLLEASITPLASSSSTGFTYQRPRISPTFLLQQLAHDRWHHRTDAWKACLVRYALAITAMQRAERLTKVSKPDLINELQNAGHQTWDPAKHPESLLMEVESGFLIRPVQMQVAKQMQDPPDGKNSVMQLNMGEGKSSVIVPVVAAALADGRQLVRVIVAKPQSKQMAQMLISKLGGMLNRRIYYMPISRSLKLDSTAALNIADMLRDCVSSGGVLLIQPEHILSFQLMALECYILGRQDAGRHLVSTLDFFDGDARDIVDESDENFNVRFELIYTMGTQCPIELSPDRWLVVQQLLNLVRVLAPDIAEQLPNSLEYQPGKPGSFPRIRILRPDAGGLLKERLADYICNNGLMTLQVSRQPEEIRKAVYSYITKAELDEAEIHAVEDSFFWTDTTKSSLLLIRGIVACGVLEFVLGQKRWRVNYGLASRTPPTQLAVPYRAKDNPSPRSEFSHPDVVVALTSLSYYYGGLSDEDLFVAMGHLMETDQSDVEYQDWVRDAKDLPDAFKQLQGINLKDRPLCTSELFPSLRFAKAVIDFFLAHIVFPKQMKEFPHKLSASGWDIGKRKGRPVTGFSGTNDSRCVLPTDIHHIDHPDQKHTNALVLEYILRPDNGVELMEPAEQRTSVAEHLLTTVRGLIPPVQVILDVGAQILELTNIEVAKTWLMKHDTTKEAAVFVNDEDELCVVDRQGRVDLLQTSSFSTRLDVCLIFLDEAHTRGIDLRLPSHYRAAVTLGAGLTKDRLVQACMRMRKLGKGQTVVFCISREIQAKILEYKNATGRKEALRSSNIKVMDVILWSISETHVDLRRSMPLWAVQGERFFRQDELWQQALQDGRTKLSQEHAEKFQEKEAQSLDDRFRPRQGQSLPRYLTNPADANLRRIAERCEQFDGLQFNASVLQEEQERELSPEIEQERQVQRAPPAEPARHKLHEDVRKFALAGVFVENSTAYVPAYESMRDTSAAALFSVSQLAGKRRLLVTADFAKTVLPSSRSSHLSDAFQRPVQWLLTSRSEETAEIDRVIIISPFEANQLYRLMGRSTAAALHLFKPRCNSGYAPLDELTFHTVTAQAGRSIVPRSLAVQLALFSGQLYISSYGDYREMCEFLGLAHQTTTAAMTEQGWKVAADGFILSDDQGRLGARSGLGGSPVGFFKILMSKIRRNGDGITKTHMGSLLEGGLFRESDFEG
ncbi:hypothetical protein DHEL01_v210801 [Diaporthe helianthi]|uniref:ubiquitinyl hydrolase 1 n=1 Tax=Diaporthe helianthi TaxID=158607 RepID=A0A2P5HKL7_DIAHE|nr:hypothetical protein DHEL01_v210801 [Diaporthe helianthi]